MPAVERMFVWAAGVRVAGTVIWCDPPQLRPRDVSFVSSAALRPGRSAHAKGPPDDGRVIASAETLAALAIDDGLPAQLGRPFALGRLRLELLPAGSMPGAAQLLVEGPGLRALYAGAVSPLGGRVARPAQVRACYALALRAPLLARTLDPLPPRPDVETQLVAAVAAALDAGHRVALGAAGLPTALETIAVLGPELRRREVVINVSARWSPSAQLLALDVGELDPLTKRGGRPSPVSLGPLERLPKPTPRLTRIAVGDAGIAGVDLSSPLSAHADLPTLLDFIRSTGAVEVDLVEPLSPLVAEALATAAPNLTVRLLGPPSQVTFFAPDPSL